MGKEVEKRQYVRMSTVFPVELQVFSSAGERKPSRLLQGFTRDIGSGGLCIELKSFELETEDLLHLPNAHLKLTINPVFSPTPIYASARIAWLKKEEGLLPAKFLIGAAYTEIDERSRMRILNYAKKLVWIPRLAGAGGVLMLALLSLLFVQDQRLVQENKKLVNQLIDSAEKKSEVASRLNGLQKRKALLEKELDEARDTLRFLQTSIAALTAENASRKSAYEKELLGLEARQETIGRELKNIQAGKEKLKAAYETLNKEAQPTAESALRQMVEWLKAHVNFHTGLISSYEGDASLEDWAFTYDQTLAAQVFLLFGDTQNAKDILSFYEFRAKKDLGGFASAYSTLDGEPLETQVSTGPNLWVGIAALQYQRKTGDARFMALARQVADWAIGQQDSEGGLRGGPNLRWYSTEHNLDAYAFFSMLYQVTGEARYEEAKQRTLGWVKKYAYSAREKRMNRGKGDATIATDTFAWAIAAIGPAVLKEISFDPEGIMEFAEKNCQVKVSYKEPSGRLVKVQGFDFAKAQNVGRGGVISTEWTAQMIVTYRILAGYFKGIGDGEKAQVYSDKASFYLNELQKLTLTSPSRTGQGRGCLPYASQDNVDTGHGWRTPKGQRTGSVSATAYGIFAWVGHNPFSLERDSSTVG